MKWVPPILLPLLILLSSCSLLGSDEPALRLQTDRERYELDTAELIKIEVKNISSSVIYFSTCMPTTLEELEGSRVVATLGFPVCYCICRAELEADERWSYRVSVDWIEQHKNRLELGEYNRYRFRLAFYTDKEMRKPLAEAALYTNRFTITE